MKNSGVRLTPLFLCKLISLFSQEHFLQMLQLELLAFTFSGNAGIAHAFDHRIDSAVAQGISRSWYVP